VAQIAWYRLSDESGDPAVDSSGNGYDGTYTPGTGSISYGETGPLGVSDPGVQAIQLTSGALVDIDACTPAVGNEGTLMAWVKLPSGATWGSGGAANGEGGIVHIANTAGTYDVLLVFGGLTDNEVSAYGNQVSAAYTPTLDNDWHHFAVTWKAGETTKLYQDGALVAQSGSNGTGIAPFSAAGIGDTSLGGFTFTGWLSQVKIYDTALSAAEISSEKDIYNVPVTPTSYTGAETGGLAYAVQGATGTSQSIIWTQADGTVLDLSGATITGTIRPRWGSARAIAGTLTITDAAAGTFAWEYDAADLADAGDHLVQFTATYGSKVEVSRYQEWTVRLSV
jgi:hypothetical protein